MSAGNTFMIGSQAVVMGLAGKCQIMPEPMLSPFHAGPLNATTIQNMLNNPAVVDALAEDTSEDSYIPPPIEAPSLVKTLTPELMAVRVSPEHAADTARTAYERGDKTAVVRAARRAIQLYTTEASECLRATYTSRSPEIYYREAADAFMEAGFAARGLGDYKTAKVVFAKAVRYYEASGDVYRAYGTLDWKAHRWLIHLSFNMPELLPPESRGSDFFAASRYGQALECAADCALLLGEFGIADSIFGELYGQWSAQNFHAWGIKEMPISAEFLIDGAFSALRSLGIDVSYERQSRWEMAVRELPPAAAWREGADAEDRLWNKIELIIDQQ